MSETFLPVLFLGVMAACFVAMTLTVAFTARELRHTLRRVNAVLPGADRTLREAHHCLQVVHQLISRTNTSMRQVETVVHQVCGAASDLVERWAWLKQRAEALWTVRMGNGTRAEPRSHHRRRSV